MLESSAILHKRFPLIRCFLCYLFVGYKMVPLVLPTDPVYIAKFEMPWSEVRSTVCCSSLMIYSLFCPPLKNTSKAMELSCFETRMWSKQLHKTSNVWSYIESKGTSSISWFRPIQKWRLATTLWRRAQQNVNNMHVDSTLVGAKAYLDPFKK